MREVRLRFAKIDNAKYIGHLDINRVMSRAFKRAEVPLWYTEGFNPHPWMSFSLPLSLGVESLCESVDIRLVEPMTNDELKIKMNSVLPTCIKIIDVYDEFSDCSQITFSDYVFEVEFTDNEKAERLIKEVIGSNSIMAMKKGKSHGRRVMKETDIKPYINKCGVSVRDDKIIINTRLNAGTEKNLSPTLLFDTVIRLIDMDYEWKSIKRLSLIDKNNKEFR